MDINKLPDKNEINKITRNLRATHQLPAQYNDTLSYQGLIYKLAQYIEDTSNNVADWNVWLEDFVNTFDTKLQDTVRERLQELYDSGQLAELVAQVIDVIQDQIDGVNSKIDTEIDGVNSRVDTEIIAVQSQIDGVNSKIDTEIDGVNKQLAQREHLITTEMSDVDIQNLFDLGGRFKFSQGEHVISPKTLSSDTTITANHGAIIKFSTFDRDIDKALFYGETVENVTINGLFIEPLNQSVSAPAIIQINNGVNIDIVNNTIQAKGRANGEGINVTNCENILINNNIINGITRSIKTNPRSSGILAESSKKVHITNNHITNCNRHGIGLQFGCEDVWILNNYVDGTMLHFPVPTTSDGAIDCYGENETNIYIKNNTVKNTGVGELETSASDIRLSGSQNVVVDGNILFPSSKVNNCISLTSRANRTTPAPPRNISIINNKILANENVLDFLIDVRYSRIEGGISIKDNTIKGLGKSNQAVIHVFRGTKNLEISGNKIDLPNQEEVALYMRRNPQNENESSYQYDGKTYTLENEDVFINDNQISVKGAILYAKWLLNAVIKANIFKSKSSDPIEIDDESVNIMFTENTVNGEEVTDDFLEPTIWEGEDSVEVGGITDNTGETNQNEPNRLRSSEFIPVNENTYYTAKNKNGGLHVYWYFYDVNLNYIHGARSGISSPTRPNTRYIKIKFEGELGVDNLGLSIVKSPTVPISQIKPKNIGEFNTFINV